MSRKATVPKREGWASTALKSAPQTPSKSSKTLSHPQHIYLLTVSKREELQHPKHYLLLNTILL
jgi:hypothetical protein